MYPDYMCKVYLIPDFLNECRFFFSKKKYFMKEYCNIHSQETAVFFKLTVI